MTSSTPKHAREHRRRQVDLLRGTLRRWRGLLRRDDREHDAARDRHESRHDERGAPADVLDQEAGRQRGRRDAEVAGEAVHADHAARPVRALHEHRDADRVVDRRERADDRERDRELPGRLRQRDEERRRADAEEEHQHHRAAAPMVAEAPGRQRADAEQHERAGRERHQVLPARDAEVDRDRADRGREHQQHQVVDRVRDVEQQRDRAGVAARRRGARASRRSTRRAGEAWAGAQVRRSR